MLEDIKPNEEVTQAQSNEVASEREYNFKMMRDRAEAAERRAADIEAQYQVRQQQHQAQQPAEDDGELVERRYVKQLEKRYQESEAQREADKAALSERLLRQSYKDFDDVVTSENIQKLARKKPALYRSIQHNPDMYDKGETAYDAIKSFVVDHKYAETNRRLEANEQKPRPAASMAPQQAETPLAHMDLYSASADGRRRISPERKKELQEKMAGVRGNYW